MSEDIKDDLRNALLKIGMVQSNGDSLLNISQLTTPRG